MLLIALAMVQAAPFDVKGDYGAMIRTHCRGKWPDDFNMQKYCSEQQVEGMGEVRDVSNAIGRPLDKALEKCVEKWTNSGIPDWQMIGYCAKQQAEGYRAVNR